MATLHEQLRARRKQLGIQQKDMPLRIGMSRQQYHRLENGGNPSLKTLELVADGLNMEVLLIPKEHLHAVRTLIARSASGGSSPDRKSPGPIYNPWDEIFGDDDEK